LGTIDHLGIAVRSIAAAEKFYEALGLSVVHREEDVRENVLTATIPVGESRVMLLEPTRADSAVGRFLAERGEGLHHVALHVDDISAAWEALKAQGARLASDEIETGTNGRLYFYVHPESAGGMLTEICQDEITGV
jgi:methylmalonyl-CoA epimerase